MGVDAGTSGSLALDEFVSQRLTMPELLPDSGAADPEPTAQPSWLDAS
jgi:hypothetical protein